MAMRLLDSPRLTNDIDYVFVPYSSKKDVHFQIEAVLTEIEGAVIEFALRSSVWAGLLRILETPATSRIFCGRSSRN